jgi:DNA-binding response OmpR family regulator
MRPMNVVLAQRDAVLAQQLAASLRKEFRNIEVANNAEQIRSAIARFRAPFAVVDLELVESGEVKHLCAEFPSTAFVCIHRLADDRMWTEVLATGAVDCCHAKDVRGIWLAAESYVVIRRSQSAAA